MRLIFTCFVFILSVSSTIAQDKSREKDIIGMEIGIFNSIHYSGLELNNKAIKDIYHHFIYSIDEHQTIFDQGSIANLIKSGLSQNSPTNKLHYFFNAFSEQYLLFAINKKEVVENFKNTKQNYLEKDVFLHSENSLQYIPKTQEEANKRLYKRLKKLVLSSMVSASNADSTNYSISVDSVLSHEEAEKKEVLASYNEWFDILETDKTQLRQTLLEEFLNSIANQFDPHSNYFSPQAKQDFENQISTEAFLFGFSIKRGKESQTLISKITPGGAAWKSNKLNEGDIIIKVKTKSGKVINAESKSYRKVYRFIFNDTSDEITLTVKKSDGSVKKVNLKKQKVEVEENSVKSFVLNGSKKIGYISLPAFYTDYQGYSMQGCANDVAKELVKLKQENVDGIILDLRYNGGGSMKEAVGLAGIFIDAGPILVQKVKGEKPFTIKDFNRGLSYAGPLAVMVNRYSASASEILAGTLQDYNRAIIVGSATYGKATAQSVYPLDSNVLFGKSDKINDFGFAKITVGKLYRIKGNTHQLKGVIPDIITPNLSDGIALGESEYPTALSSDSITKKMYYTPLEEYNTKNLQSLSAKRVSGNPNFNGIKEQSAALKKLFREFELSSPLNINEYRSAKKKVEDILGEIELFVSDSSKQFSVKSNEYDSDIISLYEELEEQNKQSCNDIQKDIYIEEAYNTLIDLINK